MNEKIDIINIDNLKAAVQDTIIQNSLAESVGPSERTEDVIVQRVLESLMYRADSQIRWASETGYKVFVETEELERSPYAQFDTVVSKIEQKQAYQQQLEIQELFFSRLLDQLQCLYIDITGEVWKPRKSFAAADAKVADTTAGMEMSRYREKFKDRLKKRAAEAEKAEAEASK